MLILTATDPDTAIASSDTAMALHRHDPLAAAALRFEYFPALWHLTLLWVSDSGQIREAVEGELAHLFHDFESADNPASLWLLGVGGGFFGIILVIAVLLILVTYLLR
jgi:hypothetical protein